MRTKPRPLPARITLVLWLVLITAGWNLVRVWSSLMLAGVIQEYAARPGPVYIGVTGAFFAVLGFVLLWGYWRRAGWAQLALLASAVGYAAWGWLERLSLQPRIASSWPFSLLITTVLLAFVAAVTLDPRNRSYFGREAHEREEQARPIA